MFFIFFILFTLLPALELYLLFKIGAMIGAFETIMIIIITGFLGAMLTKTQGLMTLHNIQKDLAQNKLPTKSLMQGLCIFAGGLLLLTPGFLTDILGLLMILPLTRIFFMLGLKKFFDKNIQAGNVHIMTRFQFKTKSYNPFAQDSENQDRTNHSIDRDVYEADYVKKDEKEL